jgi:hypothetical protein
MVPSQAIVIRTASSDDARALARLAALDSQAPLAGPALLVEVDGVARAALAPASGRVVADPFHRTADLVALLRLRAQSIEHARGAGARPRVHLPRRAAAVAGA